MVLCFPAPSHLGVFMGLILTKGLGVKIKCLLQSEAVKRQGFLVVSEAGYHGDHDISISVADTQFACVSL